LLETQEEFSFTRAGWVHTELHWQIAPKQFSLDWEVAPTLQRLRKLDFCGVEASALAPEDLLFALCVHGGKHAWERLIWIADIALLVKKYPQLDLAGVRHTARAAGVERIVATALALAHGLFGVAAPQAFADLAANSAVRQLVRRYQKILLRDAGSIAVSSEQNANSGLFGEGRAFRSGFAPLTRHLFVLRSRERWSARARYVWRYFCLPASERVSSAVPRRYRLVHSIAGGRREVRRGIGAAHANDVNRVSP
jgi:hypothetical protein